MAREDTLCQRRLIWFTFFLPILLDHRSVQNRTEKRKNRPSTGVRAWTHVPPPKWHVNGMVCMTGLDLGRLNCRRYSFHSKTMARVSVTMEERRSHPLRWAKSQGLVVTETCGGGCPEEGARWWHWPPRLSASSLFSGAALSKRSERQDREGRSREGLGWEGQGERRYGLGKVRVEWTGEWD